MVSIALHSRTISGFIGFFLSVYAFFLARSPDFDSCLCLYLISLVSITTAAIIINNEGKSSQDQPMAVGEEGKVVVVVMSAFETQPVYAIFWLFASSFFKILDSDQSALPSWAGEEKSKLLAKLRPV